MTTPKLDRNDLILLAIVAGNRAVDVRRAISEATNADKDVVAADHAYADQLQALSDKAHKILEAGGPI